MQQSYLFLCETNLEKNGIRTEKLSTRITTQSEEKSLEFWNMHNLPLNIAYPYLNCSLPIMLLLEFNIIEMSIITEYFDTGIDWIDLANYQLLFWSSAKYTHYYLANHYVLSKALFFIFLSPFGLVSDRLSPGWDPVIIKT